ncbi:MAG: GNAT family N-acetyltransferase [Ponticaulis sp.]|nr:GNAT family N-acetyltransferase [Ponticaulis sp.]
MTEILLDRPVWGTLTGALSHLSVGGALARRFKRDVNVFAAAADTSSEAMDALFDVLPDEGSVYLMEAVPVRCPDGAQIMMERPGVQYISGGSFLDSPAINPIDGFPVQRMTDDDAADILELATLTKPGPFYANTHRMGDFFGIRIDGQLIAVAGERFRCGRYAEVSAVCVHPDFQGRGLRRHMTAVSAANIERRGDTPFIQAWADNAPAIGLYKSMGFVHRADVLVTEISR